METTFLITYYAQPEHLEACLDSIRKFYPDNKIILSQQEGDDFSSIESLMLKYRVTSRLEHNMRTKTWVSVAIGLAQACQTDLAVYIEHDAIILRNIDDMLKKLEDGEYDAIGVEEVIPSKGLERNSPGFMNQNFFMINMKKMKEKGLENMKINYTIPFPRGPIKNQESGYGISQSLENKLFLPVKDSGYGCGTFYGDVAHHMWYGSYKKRGVEYDGINRLWLEDEVARFLKDYWAGNIKYV